MSADLKILRWSRLEASGVAGFFLTRISTCFFSMRIAAENKLTEKQSAGFSQELWDLKLKLSPASRYLAECERFDANNTEFTISLLDCRYLAGDQQLFSRLHGKLIPKLVARESKPLLQGLAEVTRERHAKFGQTVFHLEPN